MFDAEFYPTPRSVAHKMLAKVSREAKYFLEPSAGKGDLAEAIRNDYMGRNARKIDCIEQSPELVSVLLGKGLNVVGYDWLDYRGVSYYDAVLVNPPFSNGDEHLLKAWDFLHDGEIVCLLNEETIKNPHTSARKRLAQIIADHGSVEYLGDCFSTAQRKTNVKVAMVYLRKVAEDDTLDLWSRETEEKEVDDSLAGDSNLLAIRDQLSNMQHYYDQANEHMLKAFQHLRKAAYFMNANGISAKDDYAEMAKIAFSNINHARAEFAQKHRGDAWKQVFEKMEFRKWLDKKQTEEFIRDVERTGNVPFTKENIKGTLLNVYDQRKKLFEKSVANVFDSLTKFYKGNTNHIEGWKTNDNYKVNQKLIFPYGCSHSYGSFNLYYRQNEIDVYSDLDRVLAVLNGDDFNYILKIGDAMRDDFDRRPGPWKCDSEYFDIQYFMKGTVHLKFKDVKLWEKFNTTAAAGKKWLGSNTKEQAA